MKKILLALNQPHPGYSDFRVYFRTIFGIAGGVFLILSIFQPFNLGQRNIYGSPLFTSLVYAGSALLTMMVSTIWIKIFAEWFSERNWTFRKEIYMIIYQMGSITVMVWVVNLLRGVMLPGMASYLRTFLIVFSTGILPYVLVAYFRHNYLLRNNLKKAEEFNALLLGKLSISKNEALLAPGVMKPIPVREFYFAEARGNYVYIYCMKDEEKYEHLCRCTMKEFEAMVVGFGQIFRCHRSFMVNLEKVIKVDGNAAGYTLCFGSQLPMIPVSRSFVAPFRQKLNQGQDIIAGD